MRDLLAEAGEHDDRRARLAIAIFCYRVQKYVGACLAAMGGAEAVVFAGGVGENSAAVRQGQVSRISSPDMWLQKDDVVMLVGSDLGIKDAQAMLVKG